MIYTPGTKRFPAFPLLKMGEKGIYYKKSAHQIDSNGNESSGHFYKGLVLTKAVLLAKP